MTVNWGKLFNEGRCKAYGVPWSEEELKLLTSKQATVDELREGIKHPEAAKEKNIFKDNPTKEEREESKEAKEEIEELEAEITLEEATKKFEEKENRPVPNNKKNDLEWIKSKL